MSADPRRRAERSGAIYSRLILMLNTMLALLLASVLALVLVQEHQISVLVKRDAALAQSTQQLTLENNRALEAVQDLQKARAAADIRNSVEAQQRLLEALAAVKADLVSQQSAITHDLTALYTALRSSSAPPPNFIVMTPPTAAPSDTPSHSHRQRKGP